MKLFKLLTIAFVLTAFVACNEDKKKSEPEVVTVEATPQKTVYSPAKTEAEFKDPKLADMFDSYINLKTALVNTNNVITSGASLALIKKMKDLEADNATVIALETIAKSNDIEEQRKEFVVVTTTVESMIKNQIASGTIYKQFCPMAFGNKGAYWLSNSKDIKNPYFGDKMLKCGRITEELK
ncbi:DUF3347 domain-containing protein [Ulvibacter antarcticus]|uniref:Uncharacterized protein DUF3347 n=1 Tax=Ulvibacter antarcticus TaxID=442714 RepID=A0A3L9Z7S7_9FLAO|nr:DUF3347 domain-containing protein [Ulvibacter antarcticus]RMA66508.1 uncharacterized protein DUF3347 [Ulvibacter antarcticus]